ncbi:hypothetical protein EW145_g4815 [Phellinidium pouzarii]|uniref:ENTH domain-containing protein n=1 Tax=Phellinidium pouzarii TaxID=167371 RepID=A0A4S4L2R3_9AGAM|nr:hypothetical protein EW145_g4815 [Phellinidium pouzarii]
MSSFDKTVKLACKPKAAPPKAKYLDPIIAATYSEDGAVHDVCKALAPRLREPNSVVVFKALIVLHTMIRNGATDNVLTYLSSEDVLRLRSVSTGHWEGYDTPKNLQNYAIYLDTRIRTYRDLKHDPVRVQTDSNRDIRVENSIEASRSNIPSNNTFKPANGPQRSKTIMGRKLRSMTVEKGLLRETKAVQRTINALVECRFYSDNLEDELNVTALRILVKDLIILFQAVNEGVINVLEHYFEMSHVDAEAALNLYRNFCKQTEKVVEYLGVARKLEILLNVPIPNLKHAPVSLVTALEEYIKDPNFEQNRIEYKTTKSLADKNAKEGIKAPIKTTSNASAGPSPTSPKPDPSSSTVNSSVKESNQALVDFFSSIEEEQPVAFSSPPNNQHVQQQTHQNPFVARQSMMMTGAFPQQPFGAPQAPTGFIQPQHTAFPGAAPFQQPQNILTQPQHPSFTSFIPPQPVQPTGFLQPQTTGANPFRQSMMMPHMTGMQPFGMNSASGSNSTGSQAPPSPFSFQPTSVQPQSTQTTTLSPIALAASNPVGATGGFMNQSLPQRPASTPLGSAANAFGQAAKPVVSHQTGSRNPFGIPQEPAPPVPKPPTLQELATGAFGNANTFGQPQGQPTPARQQPTPATTGTPFGSLSQTPSTSSTDGTGMASIASSFTFNNNWAIDKNKSETDTNGTPSLSSHFTSTSAFSSQPTGTTSATSVTSPLQPQTTGFSALKPFKPTSSFGASLLESLPPISQSGASTPSGGGLSSQPTGFGASTNGAGSFMPTLQPASPPPNRPLGDLNSISVSNAATGPSFGGFNTTPTGQNFSQSAKFSTLNAQPTGFPFGQKGTPGVGLRPQTTGSGVANPFRASMFNPSAFGGAPGLPPSQFGSGLTIHATGAPSFGANLFQSNPGDASKQQNGLTSLI